MSTEPQPTVRNPAWTAVFKTQCYRTLGARRKLGWFLLALIVAQIIALSSSGIVFGLQITAENTLDDGVEVTRFSMGNLDDFEFDGILDEGLAALWLAGIASIFWGLLWPIRVWAGEPPSRRDYHWAMPVRRSHHDLTRVLAGGVWVFLLTTTLVVTAVVTSMIFGHTTLFPRLTPWFWLNLFIAPLMLYILASIVYVRARSRPSLWLWGGFWSLGILLTVAAAAAPGMVSSFARSATFNPIRTLLGPLFGEITATSVTQGPGQVLGWLLWTSVFSAGLWITANTRSKNL